MRSLLRARDVLVGAVAAFLAVGTKGDDFVRRVGSGRRVLVFVTPGILGDRLLLPVGSVPVVDSGRRGDECLQPFLRGRIASDLELVEIERLADLADLDLRRI